MKRKIDMIPRKKRDRICLCDVCGGEIDMDSPASYDVVKTKRGKYITFHIKCYLAMSRHI